MLTLSLQKGRKKNLSNTQKDAYTDMLQGAKPLPHPLLMAPGNRSPPACPGEEHGCLKWDGQRGGNSGPVLFSTFNERSDQAGVNVQVEQSSVSTHARRSVPFSGEKWRRDLPFFSFLCNAWWIILHSQVNSPSLPCGDDGQLHTREQGIWSRLLRVVNELLNHWNCA